MTGKTFSIFLCFYLRSKSDQDAQYGPLEVYCYKVFAILNVIFVPTLGFD